MKTVVITGSRAAILQMEKQANGGFIYNVEGYGSNDATMLILNGLQAERFSEDSLLHLSVREKHFE